MIPYNQLSLADIFSDCQEIYESDKPAFLSLLQEHIDLDEIVPASFRKHFYSPTGRTRLYPLNAFLWALIIQRIFLYTHRLPSSGLPSLFQASQGILRLWKSTWRFQDHPFQTGFPGRSPERFWNACWPYGTHLPGHWPFQSRHDYLWLFRHWGLGGWK